MEALTRVISRPQAKPWRTRDLNATQQISLDENGLLEWSVNDVENPKNWSRGRRWYITIICVMMVMNASMASSAPSACLPSIEEKLHASSILAKLTVTFFVLGFCSGPAVWAPLSEYYGRRIIFASTFICYYAFTYLCAFSPNIEGLLIGRFLCGTFVSGALSNTPGIFADLWPVIERGNCMLMFVASLQMGPAIGPITAGFYQVALDDYHWIFYQLLWMGTFSLVLLPTIPETLPSRALLNKARRIRKAGIPGFENIQAPAEVDTQSLLSIFKTTLVRPWAILIDPIAFLLAIYLTIVYTLLYMLFTIFPIAFIQIRGFNAGVGELPLISVILGAFFGAAYIYWDSQRQRKQMASGHNHTPEDGLPVAMTGAICFPVGLFWFGWTAQYASIHWIVPCIGAVLVAFAMTTLFVAFSSYLSETYLRYAASAQAGNQIVRSLIACTAPLWTEQMFTALGVGGGASLIGAIGVLLMPIPFLFYRYGATIRVKSKFAPTPERTTERSPEVGEQKLAAEERREAEQGQQDQVEAVEERSSQRFDDSDEAEKGSSSKE